MAIQIQSVNITKAIATFRTEWCSFTWTIVTYLNVIKNFVVLRKRRAFRATDLRIHICVACYVITELHQICRDDSVRKDAVHFGPRPPLTYRITADMLLLWWSFDIFSKSISGTWPYCFDWFLNENCGGGVWRHAASVWRWDAFVIEPLQIIPFSESFR